MVVALLRRVYTRLGLNLFKNKHDCHWIGFEVEKRSVSSSSSTSSTGNNTFNLFRASVSYQNFYEDEFRSYVSSYLEEQRH